MTNKHFMLFLFLILAGGCASTQTLRRNYILSHPNMPADQKNAVLRGDIVIGMDIDTVIFMLGDPYRATDKETARNDVQILSFRDWDYGPGYFIKVTFVNGRATEIERTYQELPPPRMPRYR